MAATTLNNIEQGTLTPLLSTELNSVGSSSFSSLGAAFQNDFGITNFGGYPFFDVMLTLAPYTGTPTAGAAVYVWFIPAIDGTNYDNSGSTISVPPNVIVPWDAMPLTSGVYQRTIGGILAPKGFFKTIAQNVGSGVTLAASGNTIKVRPTSFQGQ